MIQSFGDRATSDIYHGTNSKAARRIPTTLWRIARRKLDMIEAAKMISDLRVPPNNRLKALKRNSAGFWSIRINDQFRILFRFERGQALDVHIRDYH